MDEFNREIPLEKLQKSLEDVNKILKKHSFDWVDRLAFHALGIEEIKIEMNLENDEIFKIFDSLNKNTELGKKIREK